MQYNTRAIQNNKGFLIKCSTRIKILIERKIMEYNINAKKEEKNYKKGRVDKN